MRGGRLGGALERVFRAKFWEVNCRGLSVVAAALDGTQGTATGEKLRDSTAALETGTDLRHRLQHIAAAPSFLEEQSAMWHCPGVQQQGAGFCEGG